MGTGKCKVNIRDIQRCIAVNMQRSGKKITTFLNPDCNNLPRAFGKISGIDQRFVQLLGYVAAVLRSNLYNSVFGTGFFRRYRKRKSVEEQWKNQQMQNNICKFLHYIYAFFVFIPNGSDLHDPYLFPIRCNVAGFLLPDMSWQCIYP